MLRNYIKIGIRNLLKNKLFSTINIIGMAISMASVLVISLFIYDEFLFDKHVEDAHLKYRVYNEHFNEDGTVTRVAMIPPAIAPTLAAEYPEVESFARYLNFNGALLFESGDKKFAEQHGGRADHTILALFNLKLLEGDPNTALTEANTIAINHTLKQKYFGEKPALGEAIEISNTTFNVVAVFEDFHYSFSFPAKLFYFDGGPF